MAHEALACLGSGEEVLLGHLGVIAVALGAPLGAALGGAAHLLDPALAEHLDVVRVETVERGDLLVELVLHRLRRRQHLLLDDLRAPHAAAASERAGRGRGSGGVGAWVVTWLTTPSMVAAAGGGSGTGGESRSDGKRTPGSGGGDWRGWGGKLGAGDGPPEFCCVRGGGITTRRTIGFPTWPPLLRLYPSSHGSDDATAILLPLNKHNPTLNIRRRCHRRGDTLAVAHHRLHHPRLHHHLSIPPPSPLRRRHSSPKPNPSSRRHRLQQSEREGSFQFVMSIVQSGFKL
jgi:hypothetical protein